MTARPPIVHIEFRSSDFPRSSAFYAKVLGWQTQQNAAATYMKLDGTDGGLSTGWVRSDLNQAPGPLAYVEVDDLAATLVEVEKAGGRTIVARRPFAGGGEVALFADPDGNVIGLWTRKKAGSAAVEPAATAAKSPKPAKPPAAAKPPKPAAKPSKPNKVKR
ncbi:MAG TPA: VOC family protein [Polyangia bacterium]|nr:VOC family protein [Polyangia bacterium]